MNTKLVESLAEIIQSLTAEEKDLLNRKINLNTDIQHRPFYEVASSEEKAKVFQEWANSHRLNTPILSDEAISRESIYGDRG
jgi:protein-arginine kinase